MKDSDLCAGRIAIEPSIPETARFFFALWPDTATCAQLDKSVGRAHEICGGRPTRAATIHLTLVFLGELELARVDELLALAGDMGVAAFEFKLTRFGWWPHNRIVWAAPEKSPRELGQLVERLRERLGGAGFRFDTKPFVPHITLLRKANCKDKALPPGEVGWHVEDFVLVKSVLSESGAAYEVVGRWRLINR